MKVFGILVKTVLLLAALELCHGSILCETLEKRLCRAQFVFKFQVVSTARKVGCAGSTTTATPTTTSTPTNNLTTVKTSNLHRILNIQSPTTQLVQSKSTASFAQSRQKRCHQVLHQSIFIRGDSVSRGMDKLKKINKVKELKIKNIYSSDIRLDLNFKDELPYGHYLFIGRQAGKIENQVFISNPATVVPWNAALEQKLNNFDFVKDCQKINRSSRSIFCPI